MADLYNFLDINGNPFEEKLHATTDSHGLMCPQDKAKLASIEEGANKTIVDSELNETSTNPVQNKVIYTELESIAISIIENYAQIGLENVDNATFKAKAEASGFTGGSKVQILTWEETDI